MVETQILGEGEGWLTFDWPNVYENA